MERTKRFRIMTNSTSGGKSPELTTRRFVSARGSDGHGAMLNLFAMSLAIQREHGDSHAPSRTR